ncbi:MAG: phosphatase PAP2 family protein [Bacteroidia bacterium]|nr:phosphatase PAP2 family protein [Bacteroidia bacterium]MCC7533523.1 phosphatase PAP2 family protein [Bacteroidia bacterium]
MRVIQLILALFICINTSAQNQDIELLRSINIGRNNSLDPMFQVFSESATPITLCAPSLLFVSGILKKDTSLALKAIQLGSGIAIASLITTSAKYLAKRDRPYITYPEIEKMSSGGSYSFPSGHTSSAFSTATGISLLYPKWYVIIPAYSWASAVAYSRMHLGVHYPTDVLAGAVIGSGSAYASYKLNNWLLKKCSNKKNKR